MLFFIFLAVWVLGTLYGLFLLFKKAAITPRWSALIPIWNGFIMQRSVGKNVWWTLMLVVPFFNVFFFLTFLVSFSKLFGKISWKDHALVVLIPFIYLPYIGSSSRTVFLGKEAVALYRSSKIKSFVYDLVYSVVLVALVNMFVLQAYVIPTPSMEPTLLVNDYLFVTKYNYGIRLPNTPLSLPLMHNKTPLLGTRSYSTMLSMPYMRWLSRNVSRGDVTVFNFPMDDTFIDREGYRSARTYYEECRLYGRSYILAHPETYPLKHYPIDKKEHFVKRCVGVPGDSIQIDRGRLYVNGMRSRYKKVQTSYLVQLHGSIPNARLFEEATGIEWSSFKPLQHQGFYYAYLSEEQYRRLRKLPFIADMKAVLESWDSNPYKRNKRAFSSRPFPYDTTMFKWTRDFYGPIWVPKKGSTIKLTPQNIVLYERIISVYEKNKLEIKDGKVYINDKPASTYTFTMDYYWLMGDNRHNSLDSRYWGFVPEDHVVGKVSFIWFSIGKGGIRWNRLFSFVD